MYTILKDAMFEKEKNKVSKPYVIKRITASYFNLLLNKL